MEDNTDFHCHRCGNCCVSTNDVPCSHLYFDYSEGVYACTIHDDAERLDICVQYTCNDGWNGFGSKLETCDTCAEIDELLEAGENLSVDERVPPCEEGNDCQHFIHRVQFFYAFAIHHPGDSDVQEKARYFKAILEKNIEVFEGELKKSLKHAFHDEKDNYLGPYKELLDAIQTIIDKKPEDRE
jgi:hypothetical protein